MDGWLGSPICYAYFTGLKTLRRGARAMPQPQLCSPIHTHSVPILDGQPWEGMLGF